MRGWEEVERAERLERKLQALALIEAFWDADHEEAVRRAVAVTRVHVNSLEDLTAEVNRLNGVAVTCAGLCATFLPEVAAAAGMTASELVAQLRLEALAGEDGEADEEGGNG